MKKELVVTLAPSGSRVHVLHRITNAGAGHRRVALWGLTVMAIGGKAILPLPPFVPFPDALPPTGRIVTRPYARLGDPRFTLGERNLRMRKSVSAENAQKIGLFDEKHGWAAYGERLFVKRCFAGTRGMRLVDIGCNVEVFADPSILELEALGEEVVVGLDATTTHLETWDLFHGVSLSANDALAARTLEPLLVAS